jgi:hypothetical protein
MAVAAASKWALQNMVLTASILICASEAAGNRSANCPVCVLRSLDHCRKSRNPDSPDVCFTRASEGSNANRTVCVTIAESFAQTASHLRRSHNFRPYSRVQRPFATTKCLASDAGWKKRQYSECSSSSESSGNTSIITSVESRIRRLPTLSAST